MTNIYTVTASNGGMIGSVRSIAAAYELMAELRASFPNKHYHCHNDGNLVLDTRTF